MTNMPTVENFKTTVGRHYDNGFIAITQTGNIRFQRNVVCKRMLRVQRRSHDKVPQLCKFNMADGPSNESRFSSISE